MWLDSATGSAVFESDGMVAIGFSAFKRGFIVLLATGALCGCATSGKKPSTPPQQASVAPPSAPAMQTVAATPSDAAPVKTANEIAVNAPATPQPQTTENLSASANMQNAQPVVAQAQLAAQPSPELANAYAQIPLTPEMTALQSAVPTPRPAAPSTQLAYAAPAASDGSNPLLSDLQNIDTTPRTMDFSFDESAPAAPPIAADNEKDTSPPTEEKKQIFALISKYSKIYEIPESLLHRVVHRESKYNPKAFNKRGYFGLMQIKFNTAKSMGYDGLPAGLFDAETNIKYAAKYLKGAWMISDNSEDQAVSHYARGYYYAAKNKGMMDVAQGRY